ncbi:DUF397 domain-containing protein [Marinactinospora rubrisoli]|uniref:DUF397 domain-containing protein n=1 Tax=Marinactinospora rubrisoli TaxID=2715399 RepID=A0ABW2KEG9_9ACTN
MSEYRAPLSDFARRTSSHSVNSRGQCVEAGPTLDGVRSYALRDAGAFFLPRAEWTAFLTAVQREEL